MARTTLKLSLLGLALFFLTVLFLIPYLFPYRHVSGFEDAGMGMMQCQEGRKPCPEGFFCEQSTCVPILPKYNYDTVVGTGS